MERIRRGAPFALASLFGLSGALHLIRPGWFRPLVPRAMPTGPVVAVSGLAELGCALGLASRQPWSGPASAVLLLAILPGNIKFALDRAADPCAARPVVALAWLRIPLQVPMIWAALQARPRD
jgi:uncharacterized membrane protein